MCLPVLPAVHVQMFPYFFYSSVIFSGYSSLGMYVSVSDHPTTNIVGPVLMYVIMLQLLNCLPINLFTSRLAPPPCPSLRFLSHFTFLRTHGVSRAAGWNWYPHCFSCDMFFELAQIWQKRACLHFLAFATCLLLYQIPSTFFPLEQLCGSNIDFLPQEKDIGTFEVSGIGTSVILKRFQD